MRLNLSNARVACLVIGFAALAACYSKQAPVTSERPALSPIAQEIQRRGYHPKANEVIAPTAWEVSTFRMRSRRLVSFRAEQPMRNTSDYYCRLSFFEETFDSIEDARHRLANIHLPDPNGPAEERDYLSALRTGFRVGNVAYVLQTDASMFWDEVQRLTKTLADAIPNAEIVSK